jgi:hypothetical protein
MAKATIGQIVEFLKEMKADGMTVRLLTPENFTTDPLKPKVVVAGIGPQHIHGGTHRRLVVSLKLKDLISADQSAVIESDDLDLDLIRKHLAKKEAVS